MKNLKKLTAVLCTLVMLLALCACGNTAAPAADPTEAPAAEESSAPSDDVAADQTFVVGICQLVQHDALDAATEGFKQALTDKLGDKVTFQERQRLRRLPLPAPSSSTSSSPTTLTSSWQTQLPRCSRQSLLPMRSPSSAPPSPTTASALEISDWTGATGFNVSGTSDLAPLDGQAADAQGALAPTQRS